MLAVLFTAGLEIAEAQSAKGPVVILFMLPFAVAMVLLAARIWRAATRSASHGTEPATGAPGNTGLRELAWHAPVPAEIDPGPDRQRQT